VQDLELDPRAELPAVLRTSTRAARAPLRSVLAFSMFQSGYWLLARWRGAPIKLHWSIVLGLLVFGGLRWSPGFFVAYPCLVLVHELGHAALVRRCGHRVVSIEVTGLGGACHWSGNASAFEESLIAWGGVLAQLVVFGATLLWLSAVPPSSSFGWQMAATFTHTNLWLVAINLLPIPPLDGARAWGIFRAFRERGAPNLPQGTWRDRSHDAQRAWFDNLRSQSRARPAQRVSELDADPDGPLNAETQQAIDRLLKGVTGKARDSERGD
jgi:Zn-dependent protease